MKATIHPKYYHDAVVTCNCGSIFATGSTKKEIQVDICSQCHPFFTGEMRFVDTMGRVEKFQKKQKHAAKIKTTTKKKVSVRKKQTRPETLREMMLREKKKLKNTQAPKQQSSPKKG